MTSQDYKMADQLNQCIDLLKGVFGNHLLGVYLYGSSVVGGLQKYSDIDLFVISGRVTTDKEKQILVNSLLQISGIYMKSAKLPIELTIVVKSEINPWRYPPSFDFQYGEWLRNQFEGGNIKPWLTKEIPDLAILITQVLLASKTLVGTNPNQLLCNVPYKDFIDATTDALPHLMSDINSDTRNVLLTLARIWNTLATDTICSKPAAVDWVISYLPEKYHPVMLRAKAICKGEEQENWDDIQEVIKPCADFIIDRINSKIIKIKLSNNFTKSIKLAELDL
jgi:streptomycin 3"-adenylyltransferase